MSNQYHKIQSVFKRDEKTKRFTSEYAMEEFDYLKDCRWQLTEKVDGTNIRVMWDGENVTFGGKTDAASIPTFLLYKLQALSFEGTANKQKFKEIFIGSVCLYGEGYGAKIQSGGKYVPDGVDFVLFDVYCADMWLKREDVIDIANKLGIRAVPILGYATLSQAIEMAKKGFPSQWGDFTAEGLVLRPFTELLTRRGERIITKLKYRDFN